MMRCRVLIVITELHPAGAERIVFELATRLPAERWELEVVSLRSPGGEDGAIADQLRAAGVPVTALRFAGKTDPRGLWRWLRVLRRFRPQLIHAHLFHANLAARLFRFPGRQRVVSTIHVVERRPLPLRRRLERWTARQDDATVCVSAAVGEHACAELGVRPERLRVIPNGIDLARYTPAAPEARAAARVKFGLPADGLLVGAVGRLSAQKGLPDLIEAFARLEDGAGLVLAGAGEEEGALRRLVAERELEGRVHLLGFQRDVPAVLAAIDVFCMPSHWEGFGLSLAEALAAGKPAVATRVDSLPEVMGEVRGR